MNGVVPSVPWHGHQEYRLMLDTSVLLITLEKSTICHAIVKTNQHRINLLKMARFTFNRVYPEGTKGVANVISLPQVRNCSQRICVARPITTHATRTAKNSVSTSHHIYIQLQKKYGLSVKKRKRKDEDNDNNNDSEDK